MTGPRIRALAGSTTGPLAGSTTGPLAGMTILLTADRRVKELSAAFGRRGAAIEHAPALVVIPHLEDHELVEATRRVLAHPPDIAIVTTGIGFQGWIESADAVGLADELIEVLSRARLIARGPKARGAIEATGLVADWVASSETSAEIRDLLLAEGVAGQRIAIQHHGSGDDGLDEALSAVGAVVDPVVVYSWGQADESLLRASVERAAAGRVDVVVFTSAPGATAWLAAASESQVARIRAHNHAGRLVLACVGPITAAPLRTARLDALVPGRWRLGALIREVVTDAADRPWAATSVGALRVHARTAVLDDRIVPLSSTGAVVLRILVQAGGGVVSRERLVAELPASADLHSVDVAVARLRAAFETREIIRTVVKRGYALAVESLT